TCPSSTRSFPFTPPPSPPTSSLSLHDALPISAREPPPSPSYAPRSSSLHLLLGQPPQAGPVAAVGGPARRPLLVGLQHQAGHLRSEEHTSELQSLRHLVCRLLLEKKKNVGSTP